MKSTDMIKKNTECVIDITGMGSSGEGVGKIDGYTLFVKGAILGEKVKVRIIKANKNYGFAKLIEVIEPSLSRIEPKCGLYEKCGGCQLQHIDYKGQLSYKTNKVKDCLRKIGKISIDEEESTVGMHDTMGMENPYRYRNKVQLPVRKEQGKINIGFYAERSHRVIDIDTCLIQQEAADKITKLLRKWIEDYNIKAYDEVTHTGVLRHIMIRNSYKTKEIMIVLVTKGNKLPNVNKLISIISSEVEEVKSIIQNVNNEKTNVILGQKCVTLWGKDTITDYIGDFKFNISPLSFFQVNPIQTEVLYNKALEYAGLKGDEIVFDAYCGTGTISLFLAQKAKKVIGVEIIKEAVDNAVINAKENNITNAEFITGKSEEVIPDLIEKGIQPDVVVVDPPRKGCEKVLLEAIAKANPKKIVYVSCDPATLARDLNILEELGYKTKEVQPVDMFPMTGHVETIALLTR